MPRETGVQFRLALHQHSNTYRNRRHKRGQEEQSVYCQPHVWKPPTSVQPSVPILSTSHFPCQEAVRASLGALILVMSRKKPNGSAGLTDEANPTPANDGQSPVISEIFRNSTYLNWCRILSQVYRKKLSHADWKWPQPLLSKLSSALSRLEEGKQLRAKKKKDLLKHHWLPIFCCFCSKEWDIGTDRRNNQRQSSNLFLRTENQHPHHAESQIFCRFGVHMGTLSECFLHHKKIQTIPPHIRCSCHRSTRDKTRITRITIRFPSHAIRSITSTRQQAAAQ